MIFDSGACIVSVYPSALAIWINQRNASPLHFCPSRKKWYHAPLRYQAHADSRAVGSMYLKFREAF